MFISEKDHPRALRKRNWTGEDGGRRLVQKSRGAAVWTWRKDALQGI